MDEADKDRPDQAGTERQGVRCSCEWASMDTGNHFYSRISKPDPDCPVHRREQL